MKTNERRILVTGGAGYIGRCTVELLLREGYEPVILDNFSTGHRSWVKGLEFEEVDLTDLQSTRRAIKTKGPFHAVFHFAAKASVTESCAEPELYLRHN